LKDISMQTTLRINDEVFRSAKAAAAQAGVTLTSFIEDALRQRVAKGAVAQKRGPIPTFDSGVRLPASFNVETWIKEVDAQEDQHLIDKLLRSPRAHSAPKTGQSQ
jgi:hypothetical protein